MGSDRGEKKKKEVVNAAMQKFRVGEFSLHFALTVIPKGFHHDLRLGELVGEADLTGHFAARVAVCVQLFTAAAVLHHAALTLLILSSPRASFRQVDPAGKVSS